MAKKKTGSNGAAGASADVAIIMGSDSDLPTLKAAAETLIDFGVSFEMKVVSAHRTPQSMLEFAQSARKRGFKVIIAAAGGAAHLPGMVAASTTLPVIGVPVLNGSLGGLDALLSIAQMPRGVPVATMAIGNACNAALLAVRILAVSDRKLSVKLDEYSEALQQKVEKANRGLDAAYAAQSLSASGRDR